ncbi:cytochrome C oxidase subunit IV family protein [Photobacterium sp. TY1-4]|uniref:cytochrome C oxidase subunit IV family protein n=1 Tax=Photobacterium sp. TY1-4 TaxID=2899122 RepID=UPI0021C112BF|nr:cytochrome C oxidase subunit IV family protein [Photobacterium sp. TY1-4]UXI03231.1 cytochrome C oxidase subunit IV family protein [Photobacterium sp. TY1-4]
MSPSHSDSVEHKQQHPISLYFKIWGLLFLLSTLSYLVDYFHLEGLLRWSLILIFMILKAGLIASVFMHMRWERLALVYTIFLPPLVLLVLVALMVSEADYIFQLRELFFHEAPFVPHSVGH